MENDKKNKLLKIKSHILRMSDNKKKSEIIDAYSRLLQYYSEVKQDNSIYDTFDIDDEFAGKYDRHLNSAMKKIIREVNQNAPVLYNIYQKIIDIYKTNDFCSHEYNVFVKTNINKMAEMVYGFCASLDDDVLKIYNNMLNRNNIFLSNNSFYAGFALDTIPLDYPCIVLENIPKYLLFYSALVHEIGHCYQFYLQRNQKNLASFNPYCEITSLLFEKLFATFLKDNYAITDTFYHELEDHVYFLNDVSIAKALSKLFINRQIGNINSYDLSYDTSVDLDKLLNEISLDCGYIMPNKVDLCLDEFHYSISNIIAMYFYEKLKNNFDMEWKNYKDFICTINYLPMNEVINEYFDINLVEDNINKFIKSYRKR